MKHHVERTSPKGPGMPFIGTCRLCGMTGLKASAALEDCENVRGLSSEGALIETISPPERITYPDPTPEMLDGNPLFDAIWNAIKGWDISRHNDGMYSGPTGNDARHIYDAIKALPHSP
jgi:hypothetical protein